MKSILLFASLFLTLGSFAQVDRSDDSNVIFERVEISPEFPGAAQGWKKFLTDSLNMLVGVDNGAPQGTYTVVVQFIVQKDGTITDLKALTKHGFGMEEEVLRIMRSSPKWLPAKQNGRIVRAYMKQPVTFVISEE